MANIKDLKRKPIIIELDKKREVKFTLGSMALLEEEYGEVEKALEVVNKGKIKDIIFFIWAALLHEDEKLTKNKVANLIDIRDLQNMMDIISQAIKADLPQPIEGESDGEPEKK